MPKRPAKPEPSTQPILIAGDLFRLAANGADGAFDWHQAQNMAWLRNLALAIFGGVPSLSVGILDHAALGLVPAAFGPAVEAYADPLWLERIGAPVAPDLSARIARAVAGKLVIAFELPANLRAVIEANAALLLHLAVSPIRFADDVFLDVACSDPEVKAALDAHAVSPRELTWQAGLVRATLEPPAKVTAGLPDDILLIADQIGNDRAMIVDGRFTSLAAYRDRLAALATGHSLTLLKPHPHRPLVADFEVLAGLPRLRLTAANSYALMASGKVKTVAAVSSSLLSEAPYFGVTAERLAVPDHRRDAPADVTIRVGALAGPIADRLAARLGTPLPPCGSWQPALSRQVELRRFASDDWGLSKANRNTPILGGADLDAVAPGELVSFSRDELAGAFVQGWHPREPFGAWSAGSLATLAFRWPADDPDRIRLEFDLIVLGSKADPVRSVELLVDREVRSTVEGGWPQHLFPACVIDRPTDGLPIQIHIRTPPVTPDQRETADDLRTLGIALFAVRWTIDSPANN